MSPSKFDRLFVYGTLGPGRPNEHVMSEIGGTWMNAKVKGTLRDVGWGAQQGYPGIDLDKNGDDVDGFLFTSPNLPAHWKALDNFEGEGYERVITRVRLENGETVDAYIYQLRSP
ncbi:MAG: gamma-glutamylcyclotransferase family protein [Pseudomonadota bacterium]